MRITTIATVLLAVAGIASAQDAIKAEKVAEAKAGSVFIRNQTGEARSSGSGFVVATLTDGSLICTNAHVVSHDFAEKQTPTQLLAKVKESKLTMVFDSGLATERTAPADVVAIDPVADLAILKVKSSDLKNLPKPLKIDGAKALVETTAVYSFGFPLGDRLSTGKGPAITIGKASVSSLRTDDQGKLSTIQIDGSLNPGNSGGPVVDADGIVIGVAVAIARDSQGIGFVIPVAEVQSLLAGRVAMTQTEYQKQNDGKVKVVFEAHISNPQGKITAANLVYTWMENGADKIKGPSELRQSSGSKTVPLKIEGPIAKAEFTIDKTDGQLAYCVVPTGGSTATGPITVASLTRAVRGKQGIGDDDKPPTGWKEILSKNGIFSCWVPEKSGKQIDDSKTIRGTGVQISMTTARTTGDNGLIYHMEQAVFTATGGRRIDTKVLRDTVIKSVAEEMKGRIVEEVDAKLGTLPGKEYTIKFGQQTALVRIVAVGSVMYILSVQGATEKVAGDDGDLFMNSFRIHRAKRPDVAIGPTPTPNPGSGTTTPPKPKPSTPGTITPAVPVNPAGVPSDLKATEPLAFPLAIDTLQKVRIALGESDIMGGVNDPITRDYGPDKGLLVGMQVGVGRNWNTDCVVAVRPIYRLDGKDIFGAGRGNTSEVVNLVAKEGYAVGGVLVSSGLILESMIFVFMKVNGDKLDPNDSYQSTLAGNVQKVPNHYIAFDGAPVIGVQSKSNPGTNIVTGLGFLFQSPEAAEIKRVQTTGTSTEIVGGFNDPIYRDLAPEGGFLVGLEIGLKTERNLDFIRGMKAIYRNGDKETMGKQFGNNFEKTVTIKAKPGYAIAAVQVIAGLRTDAIQISFLKIDGTGLNQKDGYTSEWVGALERKQPMIITGVGKPIIGITGKTNDRENTGFGLIVQTGK